MTEIQFNSIQEALADFKNGKFVVVVDNIDRENEGDLIIAAEHLTKQKCAFMIRYSSGVICAPAKRKILEDLKIPMMCPENNDTFKTAYTVSIDSKQTSTGISALDRSTTIKMLADPRTTTLDFNMPGHVFPLKAVEGGVLKRVGHTEAAVDLSLLCGLSGVAAISEVLF